MYGIAEGWYENTQLIILLYGIYIDNKVYDINCVSLSTRNVGPKMNKQAEYDILTKNDSLASSWTNKTITPRPSNASHCFKAYKSLTTFILVENPKF